jgi:hypothetical protein
MMTVMIRWDRAVRAHASLLLVAILLSSSQFACRRSPTAPGRAMLPNGRWAGDGACLAVADAGCDLVVGCGHGQFPKPVIGVDGGFDLDGTYRIEAGPVSLDPPPPAHFSGSVTGSFLLLKVVPSDPLPAASYTLRPSTAGTCLVPCV